jgi:hypothetical protein
MACQAAALSDKRSHAVHAAVEGKQREVREGTVQAVEEVAQRLLRVWRALVDALEPQANSSTVEFNSSPWIHVGACTVRVCMKRKKKMHSTPLSADRDAHEGVIFRQVPPVDWQVDPVLHDVAFCTLKGPEIEKAGGHLVRVCDGAQPPVGSGGKNLYFHGDKTAVAGATEPVAVWKPC